MKISSDFNEFSMKSAWANTNRVKTKELQIKRLKSQDSSANSLVDMAILKIELFRNQKLSTQLKTCCSTRSPSRKSLGNPGSDTSCYRIKAIGLGQIFHSKNLQFFWSESNSVR